MRLFGRLSDHWLEIDLSMKEHWFVSLFTCQTNGKKTQLTTVHDNSPDKIGADNIDCRKLCAQTKTTASIPEFQAWNRAQLCCCCFFCVAAPNGGAAALPLPGGGLLPPLAGVGSLVHSAGERLVVNYSCVHWTVCVFDDANEPHSRRHRESYQFNTTSIQWAWA